MKKFINQVELVEDQMIAGMVKAYPQYVRKLDCGNVDRSGPAWDRISDLNSAWRQDR